MSHGDTSDCAVFFTKREMDAFNEELSLELTFEQYESRIGDEIQIAEVLVDIVEDPPRWLLSRGLSKLCSFCRQGKPNGTYYFWRK